MQLFVLAPECAMCIVAPMTEDIISKLGGLGEVADKLRVERSAVSNWRLPGRRIPWKHRPALARLAAERAVPLPADFWGETA